MNKKCPYCAEKILNDALKCKHCGEWLTKHSSKLKFVSPVNRYYTSWAMSMLVFLFCFVLSENNLLPDYMLYVMLGICAVAGLISFVLYAHSIIKLTDGKLKHIFLIIFSIVLFFYLGFQDPPIFNNYYSPDEKGLRKEIDMIYKLKGEDGARKLYRNYLISKSKTMTEDEYVIGSIEDEKKTPYIKREVNNIIIDGNIGFVDRTTNVCTDSTCNQVVPSSFYRGWKMYVYENSRWYVSKETSCPRTKPYEMEPEFSRALNLVTQRYTDRVNDPQFLGLFKEIMNCVDVKYAVNDSDMSGAEGLFSFQAGQSNEKLLIFVSPRYKAQDDLVTAILLVHEFTHAMNYVVGYAIDKPYDCFEDEAMAFQAEQYFLLSLNQEEVKSVLARLANNPSTELRDIAYTIQAIDNSKGATTKEKALNYVKSQPYYQKQCAGR